MSPLDHRRAVSSPAPPILNEVADDCIYKITNSVGVFAIVFYC